MHPKGNIYLKTVSATNITCEFKSEFKSSGINQINAGYRNENIHITTTKVDDKLLSTFNIENKKGAMKRFLYLSRIEKGKGIELSLDIFKLINTKYPDTTYTIAGDGSYLDNIKEYIKENNKNIFRRKSALP